MTTSNELVDLRSGRRRRRNPRRARRLGRARAAPAVRNRPSRRWRARSASPRRSASSAESSSRATSPARICISPSDDWWQQWFADNGVPADEARASPARPPAREPGERRPRGDGRARVRLADAAAVEGRRRCRAADRAVPGPRFGAGLGLLARSIRRSGAWCRRSSASANGCLPRWTNRSGRERMPGQGSPRNDRIWRDEATQGGLAGLDELGTGLLGGGHA